MNKHQLETALKSTEEKLSKALAEIDCLKESISFFQDREEDVTTREHAVEYREEQVSDVEVRIQITEMKEEHEKKRADEFKEILILLSSSKSSKEQEKCQ